MKDLKQLIRESINEYIKAIDEAGHKAGMEARMAATQEAIDKRKKMTALDELDEDMKGMIDEKKVKDINAEVKALEKSLAKLQKQLDKLTSKANKGEKAEETPEEIIDEISLGENEGEERYDEEGNVDPNGMYDAGANYIGAADTAMDKAEYDKDTMNESFLYMQKLAGVITEGQYKSKKKTLIKEEEILKEWKIDRNLANTIINADNIEDYGDYDSTSNTLEIESGSEKMADYMDDIYIPNDSEYWHENERAAKSLSYQYRTAIKKAAEQRYGSNVKIEFF